ncbi:MAG: saccharopine dehydrogenase C-terminal domain-containing protein [Thermodesulfobacteriota bacterium]
MRIAVMGAAGKMAPGVIRDLADAAEVKEIVLADLEAAKPELERRAVEWCGRKARVTLVDLADPDGLRAAIRGCASLGNCIPYYHNLKVMEACLAEGVHYVDMGGLFHVARKQMLVNDAWRERGLTAVLGMGSAPGIVNVMSRVAVDQLDRVDSIRITDGIVNFAKTDSPLVVPYALSTIMDEFTLNPYIFEDGDWREVSPFSGEEIIDFPPPVGTQTVYCMLHSEVATIPVTYQSKGLKNLSFKLALPKAFEQKLRFLVDLGFGSKEALEVGGVMVSPRDLLIRLSERLPRPQGKPDDHKVLRVDVVGEKEGRRVEIRGEMICHPYTPWDMGTGPHSVGAPVGVVARMLAENVIIDRGALPPEVCVPPEPFFRRLAERGLPATVSVKRSLG